MKEKTINFVHYTKKAETIAGLGFLQFRVLM